ncbi:head completion/stabilization protein [Acinetobacter venetianus]|uniref:head completion/stabilization protein n=1 Tax=Acinetobacter venetianus TaxID=52133 RepID=UPI0021501DFC|nr:head completion/stabilization protein [Acinetobacter venetianus]MCR4529823.1 head completion/stabilization protein [Acinetobacter venetianus]
MLINNALTSTPVINPRIDYPSMDVTELLSNVRLDESKGHDFLSSKILDAMDNINRQLTDKYYLSPPLTNEQIRIYKRAVSYEAAALISEENIDFDTSSVGTYQPRSEVTQHKPTILRRNVSYAIADLTNRKRNRVKLL